MFSWEDQELANLIWGEADDHIVPYPEESEGKFQSDFVYRHNNEAHEESANIKLSEQKSTATKTKLHGGGKQQSNDGLSSHPELKCIGKEIDLEKVSETSKDHNDDRELGDIISNSWAKIGSFNDLDCIFSNDALADHANLDRTDGLWTLSRDGVKSSSMALDSTNWGLELVGNSSGQFGFNTEYLHNRCQSDPIRFEKPADSTCYTQERLHLSFGEGESDGTTDPYLPADSKSYLSSVFDQENMPHQSLCSPYQHFSNPYLPAYSDRNLSDQCISISVLPGTDEKHHPPLSNPAACLSERVFMDKSSDTTTKSQNMTPKEKIEKLKRRQKMRALHAIEKQQQQLNHPVPITDYSKNDQVVHGSSAVSMEEVDHNVEDAVLYKLQDVVTKLDTRIKLCMRDSLFRLGQSAMQRNYANEPEILKENISNQESFMKVPSAETDTNCIDRAVAHLLFHQPHKSTSKHTRTPCSVPLSFVTKTSESEHNISTQQDLSEQEMVESAD